jgi:Fic family protein
MAQELGIAITEVDSRQLDAAYKPFPTFAEWCKATVDKVRWDRYSADLQRLGKAPKEQLARAHGIALRAAAVDTGAIEGLYEVDRGFTFTVALQTAAWEAALAAKGEPAQSLIETQLNAYDYVVDFATKAEPITEAAIRSLHEQVVAAQETYRVVTAIGFQNQPLPKGQYKALPNHVRGRDGKMHSYAPVDVTPAEMHRLVQELRSEAFSAAHPVLQASYAHYAFVVIHPFADGNGRVARALASVFMYRARSIPLLILADQKQEYFNALQAADAGDKQPFVDFTLDRALEAMQLVTDSLQAAVAPPTDASLELVKALYVTKGGYRHEQVDEAGLRLFEAVFSEIQQQLNTLQLPQLTKGLHKAVAGGSLKKGYRHVLGGGRQNRPGPRGQHSAFVLQLTTSAPAQALVAYSFQLQLPKDCGREDDLLLLDPQRTEIFAARIDDLTPYVSSVLQIRIKMFVQGLLSRSLAELARVAQDAYRKT